MCFGVSLSLCPCASVSLCVCVRLVVSVCVCAQLSLHACVCAPMSVCAYPRLLLAFASMSQCLCVRVRICLCRCTWLRLCVSVFPCPCLCVCVCVYVCLLVCVSARLCVVAFLRLCDFIFPLIAFPGPERSTCFHIVSVRARGARVVCCNVERSAATPHVKKCIHKTEVKSLPLFCHMCQSCCGGGARESVDGHVVYLNFGV